jgi:PilZ domain
MVEKKQDQAATATSHRRSKSRIKARHPVLLRMPNGRPIEGWLLDVSSTGLGLRVPEPVPIGVAVRVDAQELLLFGSVTHCEQTDGAYRVDIKLSRSLETLVELTKLNESIFIEPEPV